MKRIQNPRLLLVMTLCFAGHAAAQVDLSGEWAARLHEDQVYRGPGPEFGEYEGFPLSEAARLKAESWDSSVYTLPERQCIPFAADHGLTIGNMRVWKEVDRASQQVVSWNEHHEWQAQQRTIWMDGRPHPPAYAPHSWQGFSTGQWVGNALKVSTTHLKMAQVDRNGLPRSDLATMSEHYMRHDDVLTIIQVVNDPVYLTEPFIRSRNFAWNPNQRMGGYSCRPAVEIPGRPKGYVPHYLPGSNPYLNTATELHGVPPLATRGGADTMYPDFMAVLKAQGTRAAALRVVQPYRSSGRNASGASDASAQLENPYATPKRNYNGASVSVLRVRDNLFMLQQDGGINVTMQVGDDSILVVDTGFEQASDALLAAVRSISSKPIRYVVNTAFTADRVGGNTRISQAGSTIGGNNATGIAAMGDATSRAGIIAHEEVLAKMGAPTGARSSAPASAWPSETYNTEWDEIFNGEAVQIFSVPAAYATGDSVVLFRQSDVISAGNVYSTLNYPVIDLENGGTIDGVVDALNRIVDLAVPANKQEGGTQVIPGRGRLTDEADVVEYRDMVTIIRDRLREMRRQRMSLAEVLAARPTADYDPRYSTDYWPAAQFVEAAYRSLANDSNLTSAR